MRVLNNVLLFALFSSSASAFTTPSMATTTTTTMTARPVVATLRMSSEPTTNNLEDDITMPTATTATTTTTTTTTPTKNKNSSLWTSATAAVMPILLAITTSTPANAAGPDWGLFEGKTGSLLHPIMMGSLFLYSAYTGFLGFQWRRQRTLGGDISDLQKQLPKGLKSSKDIQSAMKTDSPDNTSDYTAAQLQAALPVAQEIEALQAERKELSAKGPRDQHFGQGAMLAFLGTAFAIEGPLNTYARAGKLFPGPHLYAGAGLVVIWALAVATIPAMQKGNDTARTIHIGANLAGLGLFAWQIQSGIPILLKVWELTKFP